MQERRRAPRLKPDQLCHIILTIPETKRTVAAKLIDANEHGLGLEAYVRIARGTVVEVKGEMSRYGVGLKLEGAATVRYCRSLDNGLFHIGLELTQVAYGRPTTVAANIDA